MSKFSDSAKTLKAVFVSPEYDNDRRRTAHLIKAILLGLFKFIVIVGISYVILGPIIGMVANSFFSDDDAYSALVYLIPQSPTLERYEVSITILDYLGTLKNTFIYVIALMAIQVFMCSMVGYGFARYNFPLKKIWFGCVVIMIVIPVNTIMLPLYMTFRIFDPFGIVTAITGKPLNLMASPLPMYIMTFFVTGLRAGLYIYIFNQFFRGLPKEIEEAAFVDGAGSMYTYFFIMLVNALPAVVTVAIFSLVWQYNDTFYASLFHLDTSNAISMKISTLADNVANAYSITDPNILELYTYAGIILVILPVLIVYMILQRQFIEGVERSGIVG